MPYKPVLNPWQVCDSDDEEEFINRPNRSFSFPPRTATPTRTVSKRQVEPKIMDWDRVVSTENVSKKQSEPKIMDWNPVINGETRKAKFGHIKTIPKFERAPSHHKPIFSGQLDLKSRSTSSFKGPIRLKSSSTTSLSSGPLNLKSPSTTSFLSSFNSLLEQSQYDYEETEITYVPETPPASPLGNKSNFDPIGLALEDLTKFIYTYIPKNYSSFIHCTVRRDRTGLQKGFFPTYYLHMKSPSDGKKILLLAARKVAKINRQSEYLITTNIETLTEKSGGNGCVGRLRGNNVTGTEYTLYDNGKSAKKYGYKPQHSKHDLRRELAAIIYNTNILGLKGPRQINALIPTLGHNIQPVQSEDTILDRWKNMRFNDVLQLRNQLPKYNEEAKMHILQFSGNSVVKPSIKNFQMIIETGTHEEVVMQFGRVNKDTFTCDYRYPLSAIQAFGIALSSFEGGIARE